MRPSLTFATFVASAAALCGIFAPSAAAYPGGDGATATIQGLESAGYTVHVDSVGSAPQDSCSVISVRNPHTVTRLIKVYKGPRDENGHRKFDLVEVVVSKSIQVSLNCTGSA